MSVVVSYPLLSQEEIQTARRLTSLLGAKGYGSANALFELLTGTAPPGAQVPLYHPHDHCRVGVPLPRNSVFSYCQTDTHWAVTIPVVDTWYHASRPSVPDAIAHEAGPPDFPAYITPNIDSNTDAVGSNPCALEAKVFVHAVAGTTKVRFWNRTTGTASSEKSTATTGSVVELAFDDVPVRGGEWNWFDIELQSTDTTSLKILEVCLVETREASQPQSSGSATMTGASKP